MKINRKTWFEEAKKSLFKDKFAGKYGEDQIRIIGLMLDEVEKRDLKVDESAYIFSTAYRETAYTMRPITEYGSDAYLKNKKYWPYIGRGLAQLTWEKNYKKASILYGVDFVKKPDLALEEKYAVPILFDGMIEGWFSGKKLSDYIDNIEETFEEDLKEFEEARKIVNGKDKKRAFADTAFEFRRIFHASWVTNEEPIKKDPGQVVIGTGVAGAGTVVLIEPIKDLATSISTNQGLLTSGSLIKLVVGLAIVAGAAYVVYARWDAAGRPKFWKR